MDKNILKLQEKEKENFWVSSKLFNNLFSHICVNVYFTETELLLILQSQSSARYILLMVKKVSIKVTVIV